PDGDVALCMRVRDGAFKTKRFRDGSEGYLHRIGEDVALPEPGSPAPDLADPDTLNEVYAALLDMLDLADDHRERLTKRGPGDDPVDRNGYRTLYIKGRAALARRLYEQFGEPLMTVPGFVVREGEGGRYLTLAGAAGLVVPVRDADGRVIALLVRRDADDG